MTESEKWYDEVLAPQLMALVKDATSHGVNVVVATEYAPGETTHTAGLNPGSCFALELALHAAQCGGNVDILLIWLLKRARSLPGHLNMSVMLRLLESQVRP